MGISLKRKGYLKLPLESITELVDAFHKVGIEVSASLLLNDDGSYGADLHPLILGFLHNYNQSLRANELSVATSHSLLDQKLYKTLRHGGNAGLDLFFIKTKRRNIEFTGQIAAKYYFTELLPNTRPVKV